MADARGMLVLAGGASEFESDMRFWLFVDALDEYVRGLPPARLAALDDDVHTELGHVLPSWSASAENPRSPRGPALPHAHRDAQPPGAAGGRVAAGPAAGRPALGRLRVDRAAVRAAAASARPARAHRDGLPAAPGAAAAGGGPR